MDIEKIKKKKTTEELIEFGIINIDKPSGPTSFDISDFVRKKIGARKTSHFGTLDPKVTGVLPIALNRGCKLTGFFLGENKEYVGIMRLHEEVDVEKIRGIIKKKFTGIILQTPPVKSRVKRVEREREIMSFEILEQDENGKDYVFRAEVQGGTYIRKLIDDLGKELGIGAHMLELRRIRAGIFKEDDKKYPSVNLYDFERAVDEYNKGNEKMLREIIIPGETVTELYPVVNVKKDVVGKLFNGSPLFMKDLDEKHNVNDEKRVCVFSEEKFIGIYTVIDSGDIFAKPLFVLQPIK
jgi:H/ACA ribonucleoprotein complex subunit 4